MKRGTREVTHRKFGKARPVMLRLIPVLRRPPPQGPTTAIFASAVLLQLLTGCAFAPPASEVVAPHYEIEVETVEAQAASAVASTPLEFLVPLEEADGAWGRARLFFSQYVSGDEVVTEVSGRTSEISTATENGERFRYKVRRTITPNGYRFVVECAQPKGDEPDFPAQQNARNLARFIREGTLELTLLAR
jgi:hypothetical protein